MADRDARPWQTRRQARARRIALRAACMRAREAAERQAQEHAADTVFRGRAQKSLAEAQILQRAVEDTAPHGTGRHWAAVKVAVATPPCATPRQKKDQQPGRAAVALPRSVRQAHQLLGRTDRGGKARRARSAMRRWASRA